MDEVYRFDDASYTTLGAAGISWQSVLQVLRARPRIRQHLGAVLRIAAPTAGGQWIAVALVEDGDDEYLVVGARQLEPAEIDVVTKMLEGGQR
ncbi:hypothetical protein [Micromonospora haikouensis]|uniref:hypothetical protein n=1 Tax=Micromonospora haikouensis TaxID=686309 RepID=UPI0037B250C9